MLARLWTAIRSELEQPLALRWLGSGWWSGAGSVACGLSALLLVVSLRYPELLATPVLTAVTGTFAFRVVLHIIIIAGYVLAMLSLLLRSNKLLGFTGLALTVAASLIAGGGPSAAEAKTATIYFGVDFFVLNVLITGFLFVPLERLFPLRREQRLFRPEWDEDFFYYVVSSLIVQIVTFMTLAPSMVVNATAPLTGVRAYIGSQPFLLQFVLIMLFTDFAQYWLHRAFHQVPFLWQFHAVHHSARSMDWLAGGRMHILEVFALRGVTAVPMLSFGFDPAAIQAYVLFVYLYSALVHANVAWKLNAIDRFFVTPRFHHWHHGIEKEAIDVNFAIHFPLYDWLFGTYYLPEKAWPSGYGVGGHPVPNGYRAQFLYPFRWLVHRLSGVGESAG